MRPDEDRPSADRGVAGASAGREYERRSSKRVHKILMHHPFADKAEVAARPGPNHEMAFRDGEAGELAVARVLDRRLNDDAVVLHDRALPGRRGNIDHIVVAPSGVWVIDAKRYAGKLAVWQPESGDGTLTIRGRDRTALVHGVAKQVANVEAVLAELGADVRVRGALCFVDTELPQGRRLTFDGWYLLNAKQLAKRINITTPCITPEVARALADQLAVRLPPA